MMPKLLNRNWVRFLFFLLAITGGIYIFFSAALIRPPLPFRDLTRALIEEKAIVFLVSLLLLTLLNFVPGGFGRILRWFCLSWWFGATLQAVLLIKRTAFFNMYGILPWADAIEYYGNAQRLLAGFSMQGTTVGRPIFSSFFSFLLSLTQADLTLAIPVLVFVVMVSMYLLSEKVREEYGPIAAGVSLSITFIWYRNYLGAISSESLGLVIAALGWIFLFSAVQKRSGLGVIFSIFTLSLAMVTRAGPFLILPCLIGSAWFIFPHIKTRLVVMAGGIAAFIAGFGFNTLLIRIVSAGGSVPFTSYFYSLYGMASGGKGWGYIQLSHPEVWAMAEPARTQTVINLVLEAIKLHPDYLLKSMLSQYYWFFGPENTSLFSYLFTSVRQYNLVIMVVMYLSLLLGVGVLIWRWKKPQNLILLAVSAGILLSVPFVPPQDESLIRPYAVVVPIIGLLPGIFLQEIWQRFRFTQKYIPKIAPSNQFDSISWISSGWFALIVAALVVALIYHPNQQVTARLPQTTCSGNTQPYIWNFHRGNSVTIREKLEERLPNWIETLEVKQKMHAIYMSEDITFFEYVKDGMTTSYNVDLRSGKAAWMFVDEKWLPADGIYVGCGDFHHNPLWSMYDVFIVDGAQGINRLN